MKERPDKAAPWLFSLLVSVEVIRQHSFWITVLGNSIDQQIVAVASAAGFSASQVYLSHHATRSARAFLEAPRARISLLITLLPLTAAWILQILAIATTAALDVAIRLGKYTSASEMLADTGLSTQGSTIVLGFWSLLVTAALLAAATSIGIRTADGQDQLRQQADQEHELELQQLRDQRNLYQDLYNQQNRTSSTPTVEPLTTSSAPASSTSSIGSAPNAEPLSIGSAPSNGSDPSASAQSAQTSVNPASESAEDLLDLQCPHCSWRTGPRAAKSARLSRNAHLGRKHGPASQRKALPHSTAASTASNSDRPNPDPADDDRETPPPDELRQAPGGGETPDAGHQEN